MNNNTLPGFYEGFTEKLYPSYCVKSQYIAVKDGTKLAADFVLPADENGNPVDGQFPVIMLVSRGDRFNLMPGKAHNGSNIIDYCVPYGYVGCILEIRGAGASYGTMQSFASLEDRADVNAVIDYIGEQPFCNGKVAIFGGSNRGLIQLAAAVTEPAPSKYLKAITPVVANADFYYQDYPNGVSALPGTKRGRHEHLYDKKKDPSPKTKEEFLKGVKPVDEDVDGSMAYEAYLTGQFGKNHGFMDWLILPNMCRDDENPNLGGEKTNLTIPPMHGTDIYHKSGIEMYQIMGLIESGTFGQIVQSMEFNGGGIIGPWNHKETRTGTKGFPEGEFDFPAEHLKWFDSVLKNVDNGFTEQPRYMYYTINAADGAHWRCTDSFPLETERRAKLYLTKEKSGTVSSVNDGSLYLEKPEQEDFTEYKVDTSIQVFDNGDGTTLDRMHQWWDGDMTPGVDEKGLTFTSAPLFRMRNNEITGVTSVDLWVTCDQKDCDFIAYLEEVKADGTSRYIANGVQRASCRTTEARPVWEKLGATYHPCMRADMEACQAEGLEKPTHLQFHIEPTSFQFAKGSRLRLTITCADCSTYQHQYDEANLPTIRLYQGGDHASFISVPFVEHLENVYNGTVSMEGYTGPATMYFFEENTYLYANGKWHRYAAGSDAAKYTVNKGVATFGAGFTFAAEGEPITDGILQNYQGGAKASIPLPSFRQVKVAKVPVDFSIKHNLYIPTEMSLHLDVFRANDVAADEKTPAVVFVHGYSGTSGKLGAGQIELLDSGFSVIGVELRSYPGNFYPDYVYDLKGSIRAIRAHADELGIDPDRIGIYGQSLGGNGALITGVTSSEPELEGTVGGNLEYSSRLQALSVGYGWSDALTMGKDLYDEYADAPQAFRDKKMANTGGENAPLSHVIGFSGPGKGLEVLRQYREDLAAGKREADPELDEMLAKAIAASPVSHIAPDCPPVVLYGGLGMTRVDIPYMQTFRTFEMCNKYGVDCFMFVNTNGEYGRKDEVRHGIIDFFNKNLKNRDFVKKTVAIIGQTKIVEDNLDKEIDKPLFVVNDGAVSVNAAYLKARYGFEASAEYVAADAFVDAAFGLTVYEDKNMAVLLPKNEMRVYAVKNRTS